MNLPEDLRGIKVDSDTRKVFDGADCDKISRGRKESWRAIETDAQRRENEPGGHLGERVEREISRAIERDWRRQNVVEGDGYDGNEGWKDGVTSGARCDPKRGKIVGTGATRVTSRRTYLGRPNHLPSIPNEDSEANFGEAFEKPFPITNRIYAFLDQVPFCYLRKPKYEQCNAAVSRVLRTIGK